MTEKVLVTGISGFIAKHVAFELLSKGYSVVGTVRSIAAEEQTRATLSTIGADLSRLSFIELDLGRDEGWAEAVQDIDYIQHIASPFPMELPKDREALVPEAVEGTLRVLKAALNEKVKRVVMTSSMVAMMYRPNRATKYRVGEADWTDPDWPALGAYVVSKTRSERAAWEFVGLMGAPKALTTVNPGFVLGPSLDDKLGTSIKVIEALMTGKYPAVPPATYPIVDVRDLANVQVKAMKTKMAAGRRLISAGESLSLKQIAKILKRSFPSYSRSIPTTELPGMMIRMAALVDPALKAVVPDIGCKLYAEREYVEKMLKQTFRSPEEAVVAAAQSLVDYDVV